MQVCLTKECNWCVILKKLVQIFHLIFRTNNVNAALLVIDIKFRGKQMNKVLLDICTPKDLIL